MNSIYEIKNIGSFAQVKGGKRLPSGHQFIDDQMAYPYIRAQDIGGGRINKPAIFISLDTYDALARYRVQTGDVCLTIAGNSVGDIGYVDEALSGTTLTENAAKLTELDGVLPKYLRYALQHPEVHASIKATAGGAAQPKLGLYKVKELLIPVPSIDIQSKIVEVLSPCDELIAANQRRILLLEESAQLLYREWFVKLRFPGHETVPVTDGVPEGWKYSTLGEVCDSIGGGTPSTTHPEYWDGDITWITPTDVTRNNCLVLLDSEKKISEAGLRYSSAKMVPAETILMTSRASIGFFALIDKPVCTNQGFISIIPHQEEARMFLLLHLLGRVGEINSLATGSTFKEITKKAFRNLPLLWPRESVLLQFNKLTYPLIQQVRNVKTQNELLKEARDMLLPRLMSGAMDVSRISVPKEVEV